MTGRPVTLDLFSALIDSRAGAAPVLGRLARRHGWPVDGDRLYLEWDRASKRLQADCQAWVPFTDLAEQALTRVLARHEWAGDAGAAMAELWNSLPQWPLWPDVPAGVGALARRFRVGILSNVDDDLLARTPAAALPLDDSLLLTSQRLRRYKPSPQLYLAARDAAGPDLLHVAASARDVRGALEAGLDCVRVRRPGHQVDPAGPRPPREVDDLSALVELLAGGRADTGPAVDSCRADEGACR
jgi:2-haloalkanoic acid dehalogenase type II